jgi:hypothetical protein
MEQHMPLRWRNAAEDKPLVYRIIVAKCAIDGAVQQENAFWTGHDWRILGDRTDHNSSVIEWGYPPGEVVTRTIRPHRPERP